MPSDRLIWHQGRIVPASEATISVLSPACQYGITVFEGIRCYWQEAGKLLLAFRLRDHARRLLSSAKLLRLEAPYTEESLISPLIEVVRANAYREDIAVRQTIYLDGDKGWSARGPTGMFIAPIPMGRGFGGKEGLHCRVSAWERINDRSASPRIKAGANYINSRMGQLEALADGYDSALFLNERGTLSEGPGSCIFIVHDGRLITPPLTASVLESVTRATLLQIAGDIPGLESIEREVDRTELYAADEVFLCGTAAEVTPVLSVDRMPVGTGTPGPVTLELRRRYLDIARGLDPSHAEWRTSIY